MSAVTDLTPMRPGLPTPPRAIRALPVRRGYPVPWFVAWLDPADSAKTLEAADGGVPDFRVVDPRKIKRCLLERRCWVCGGNFGKRSSFAFIGGPMCSVTRTVADPPSHRACAEWSIRACPFLTRPDMRRREGGLPEETEASGNMILRNPGVGFVWLTRTYTPFSDGRGHALFSMGEPERVEWYAEGRPATRAEVEESTATGLPELEALARKQAGGEAHLAAQLEDARRFFPEAS